MYFCIEKTLKSPLVSGTRSPDQMLVTELQTNQTVHQVLLYVNSTGKWTGMKNTGLKIPEEDRIYV